MQIKSGGFPLLKLRIAEDEYLPGYMANQLLYGARGKVQRYFVDNDPVVRSLSWKVISDIQGLVERSDISLPSVHECIMSHTLYPLYAWCLSTEDAQELYNQYAYSTEPSTLGNKRRNVVISYKLRKGLTWCKQCACNQINASTSAFPIWHRLHFAPNILVCHLHNIPLSTLCEECLNGKRDNWRNWTPTLECLCQNDLQDRVTMGNKMLNAMCTITAKAFEVLQGETPSNFTPLTIKQAIRKRFSHGLFKKGESRVTKILDAAIENIGEEAAEILDFNEHTVNLFITGKDSISIRNPIQILAFGYASFNGFDGLMETINGGTKFVFPSHQSNPHDKERIRIQGPSKPPTRREFENLVANMTRKERQSLEQGGRAWLLEKLQQNPGLTRYSFWNSYRRRSHKFLYLIWIDTEWYRMMLPSTWTINAIEKSVASFKSSVEITAALIYERHAIELNDNPWRKITKSILMQPLDSNEIQAMERYNPELRKALSACVEKKDGWKRRVAHTLSQMISELHPNHEYSDVNWYIDARGSTFYYRLNKAKIWLSNLKNQH